MALASIDTVVGKLTERGYSLLPGTITNVVTVSRRWKTLALTLGIEKSRFRRRLFTASFYLSKSLEWSYILPGFPNEAFRRIGHFLTSAEKRRLVATEFSRPGVKDVWWSDDDTSSVSHFLEAESLARRRFLSQPRLLKRVEECEEVITHAEMMTAVQAIVKRLPTHCKWRHQPKRPDSQVPAKWRHAAELVLIEAEPMLVSDTYVDLLARDAYRASALAQVERP